MKKTRRAYNASKGRRRKKEEGRIKSAIKTKLGNREFSSRLSLAREHVQSSRVNLTRNADSRRRFPRNFASTRFDTSILPFFHHPSSPFPIQTGDRKFL